jgi:peptidoglycan/LPS O-acetylase OafA/YrhL
VAAVNEKNRLVLIDSLRGIAAMGVVVYHLHGNLHNEIASWFPSFLRLICEHGFLGVPIFFVLSGFVISYSTDNAKLDAKYIGLFALRRSIRLDPPYWAAITIAIALTALKNKVYPEYSVVLPMVTDVIAHVFYAQDILQLTPISAVFWTLCLEIQLYLFFVLSRYCYRNIGKDGDHKDWRTDAWFLMAVGVLSALVKLDYLTLQIPGLFLPYWHHFLLGVLANWAIKKRIPCMYFIIFVIFLAILMVTRMDVNTLFATITSVFIFIVGWKDKLGSYLSNKFLLYLGQISYSLYLLHPEIGWRYLSVCKQFLGPVIAPFWGISLFISGVLVSVLSAHILYYVVERPVHRLSKRIRLG